MVIKFMPSIVTEITHTVWHFFSAKLYFAGPPRNMASNRGQILDFEVFRQPVFMRNVLKS